MVDVDLQTFQLVTELVPEAMLLVEPGGRIRAANRRALLSLDPSGEGLVGRDLTGFAGGRSAGSLRGFLETCAAERTPRTARLELCGTDGRLRAYTACGAGIPAAMGGGGAGGRPLVQLRLTEPGETTASDPVWLGDRLNNLQRQLDDLHRRIDEERRLREQVGDLQRQLAEEIQLRHELAAAARRLEWAALHDDLTGLGNRVLFHDRLQRAVAVARRKRGRVGVLMIDLDGFKGVNDNLGHHAGDAVLRAVAGRVRSIVRDADTVARLGGDEFAVLMETGVDPAGAEAVVAKIAQALDLPFTVEGEVFELGASIGLALYPDDGESGEAVLRRADAVMYRIKHGANGARRHERHPPSWPQQRTIAGHQRMLM